MTTIDRRLDDIERLLVPQVAMTIPIQIVDLDTGQVVRTIPAQPIIPGAYVDYRWIFQDEHDDA